MRIANRACLPVSSSILIYTLKNQSLLISQKNLTQEGRELYMTLPADHRVLRNQLRLSVCLVGWLTVSNKISDV